MGWFDKKSWQLRRKIRDLQAELAVAEREGKYVVEQGLFFAELQEMGDATLMVLGTADHLDSEEEAVIRNFFGRNGFTVENLRLDKTHKTLAAVEIIPPQELTKRVAKALKDDGYRLIDDSDQERASNVSENVVTLSGLIRGISALFATHVHKLIINTPIKLNMEGNRLLHWMPLVREALVSKAGTEVVGLCREPFVSAYNHYYGRLGQMENPEALQDFAEESMPAALDLLEPAPSENPIADGSEKTSPIPSATATRSSISSASDWSQVPEPHPDDRLTAERNATSSAGHNDGSTNSTFRTKIPATPDNSPPDRSADAAYTLAALYKSLIGATDQRRVRNSETVLEIIARFFGAKSACLLVQTGHDGAFSIRANSPGPRCMDTTSEGVVCVNTELLVNAATTRDVTVLASTNGVHSPTAVITPLQLDSEGAAIIYLASPSDFTGGANGADARHFAMLAKVFREFPDLLIAENLQKSETPAN